MYLRNIYLVLAFVLSIKAFAQPTADGLYAHFQTTEGEFYCELDFVNAPVTVANFVSLAEGSRAWVDSTTGQVHTSTPYYEGITFHRIVPGFVIQAGSQRGDGSDGPGYNFPDEVDNGLLHDGPYVLSMANSGPHSNGSQFFITLAPTANLDGLHTVFGRAVANTGAIDTIAAVALIDDTSTPVTNVIIISVDIMRIGLEAQSFDANSQGLPEVSALCPNLINGFPTSDSYLELTQNTGSTLNVGISEDLENWVLSKRYISRDNVAEENFFSSLFLEDRAFAAVSEVQWPNMVNFPSDVTGRIITLNTNVGDFIFNITGSDIGTIQFGAIVTNITEITFDPDGYGASVLVLSEGLVPLRFRLGADIPQNATFDGRVTGTAFTSPFNTNLSGTFSITE